MKKSLYLTIIMILLASLSLVGCGKDKAAENTKSTTSTEQMTENKMEQITLYFPDKNGEYLVPVQTELPKDTKDLYKVVVEKLIAGPEEKANPEAMAIIPSSTKVLSVEVKDHVAYVNMNRYFQDHFPGGSTNEIMIVGSIVNTLTNFKDIKAVQILVEGKPIDALSGHLDLSVPQATMTDLIKK